MLFPLPAVPSRQEPRPQGAPVLCNLHRQGKRGGSFRWGSRAGARPAAVVASLQLAGLLAFSPTVYSFCGAGLQGADRRGQQGELQKVRPPRRPAGDERCAGRWGRWQDSTLARALLPRAVAGAAALLWAGCRQPTQPVRPWRPLPAVSVALPEWFFSKDKQTAPLILLVLLFGGIVTPLGVAAWYLMGTQK